MRKKTKAPQRGERSAMQVAGWVLVAACWLFFVTALIGFDAADWPARSTSVHNDPTANPMGIVGATLANWSLRALGFTIWVLLAWALVGLVTVLRGREITHPTLRIVGACLSGLALATLDVTWFGGAAGTPTAPGGLIPSYLSEHLQARFNGFGVSLWMITAFVIGALIAGDELILRIPNVLRRAGDLFNERIPGAFSVVAERLSSVRGTLRPAGGPAVDDLEDYEEVEDEYEYEDEYEDEEEEEDEDEEEEEDEYDYEDVEEEEEEADRPALTKEQLRAKIAKLPVRMASNKPQEIREADLPREDNFEGYQFPGLEFLESPEKNFSEQMEGHVRAQAEVLEETLHTFQIDADVTGIESGPVVTLYSVQLAPGTRVARLNSIQSDLARSLQAPNIRIIPTMAGKTTVGIEVPNPRKEKVRLSELMSSGVANGMILPMFLGKDNAGEPLVADLAKMPHMLIAGTTGSGKSVCMNSIIMSWLYTKRPDELKMVLVDPKMVEMSQFSDVPHLMCPVVTEMTKAAAILEWAVGKMEERYELLQKCGVRDIVSYNELEEEDRCERAGAETDLAKAKLPNKLPYLVFVIDELADLMMTAKEVEHSIVRIAQKARAVGIHLILATQRPQANVVTGLIKSNMPCRVSFKVASGMDSRIVLDQKGAELLLGQGDMMYLSPASTEIKRCQGTLVTDKETRDVARFLKTVAAPNFERSLVALRSPSSGGSDEHDPEAGLEPSKRDPLFDQAVEIMIESGRGSVSLLQRRLAIGYSRASRLVDQMGLAGILGEHKGSVAREVMLTLDEWHQMRAMESGELENGYAADAADDAAEDIQEMTIVPVEDEEPVPDEIKGEHLY
jgi:S-DNA-T family DNA segregation ATPase FtsK/SpoIIIE